MAQFDYNFDIFEEGTAAPKVVTAPKVKPKERIRVVEETKEVRQERVRIRERENTLSAVVIITIALILATIVSSFIYLGATVNANEHEIAELQEELNIAQSQNVILNIKKDSMVSFDSVREKAEEAGMIQRDRYQVNYFELSQEDYGVVNN